MKKTDGKKSKLFIVVSFIKERIIFHFWRTYENPIYIFLYALVIGMDAFIVYFRHPDCHDRKEKWDAGFQNS